MSEAPPTDRRVLVTGGAGFVGASLAIELAARHPGWQVTAFDNLRRRGSELNLPRLRDAGVRFEHGDVRELSDLLALDEHDALVECSAEPSALAGTDGNTAYALHSNLMGAYHCLELGARTLYGATKLAGELLVEEYAAVFGLRTVVNRCGVIAGPWQMGKVDQGVFTFWLLSHYFGHDLHYIGYGGTGKQVRDLLHVDDLLDLVDDQLVRPVHWADRTVNVGGGRATSLSLHETTELCRELTGRRVDVQASDEQRPATCACTCPTASACSRSPIGARAATRGARSRTRWPGSRPTSATCGRHS